MKRSLILILMIFLLAGPALAEDYIDQVKLGNEAARSGDFKKALENYHMAETEIPESPELDYNIGGALLGQQSYEEAVAKYTEAIESDNIGTQANAHYNLGTTYYRMGDYAKAIEGFQNSLNLNPDDMDAKFNLELSRKMLKENMKPEEQEGQEQQQQKEQQKQDQEQEQEKQDKQDKQEKQDSEGEKSEEEKQQDQSTNDENKKQPDSTEQQPTAGEEKQMSKEDAERILNALRNDEKDVQKKVKRGQTTRGYSGKDY